MRQLALSNQVLPAVKYIVPFIFSLTLAGCTTTGSTEKNQSVQVASPDGTLQLEFDVNEKGQPLYSLISNADTIIKPSTMAFELIGAEAINGDLTITQTATRSLNETWEMPWGEQRTVVNHYNELTVHLAESGPEQRKLDVIFRLFDDGMGFRYHFPTQAGLDTLLIEEERTQFNLTGDHQCWWIPGDWDIYEHLYSETKLSEIDAMKYANNVNLAQTSIPVNAVNTPFTCETQNGVFLSFHEANLTNYPGMTLRIDEGNKSVTSNLVGSDRQPYKAKIGLPFSTPWRTIQVSRSAGDLITSNLIVNLNEPNKLGDVSWFKPTKYVGIWWEMHIGVATWDKASGKHGATTENAKRYIDFAAENGIGGILVEGWNTGWEHWIGFEDREGVFDFVTPYEDYDLKEVVEYGRSKGVELIMHHETSAAPRTYDQQMDTAYALMQSLGIHSVKTGYVGKIIPKGEYHHGQWMVNHYRRAVETAAKYQVAVNAHEPIKATGLRRTYPNIIAREGLRGQEFNAWASDGGNPPSHLPTVAFTRMLAGPIDFTPGVFDIKLPTKPNNQINTTLAQQLALYVVINSPVQMACDLPQHYEGQPDFQFIRDVGVNWEQTKVLNAKIGDLVTIAREERGTGNWFVGSIAGEQSQEFNLGLDFLPPATTFKARIYKDGADAHWNDNPTAIEIEEIEVTSQSTIPVKLAEGGGFAMSLIKQ